MCDTYPSVFTQTTHKARKPHQCCECAATIVPSAEYVRAFGVWEGTADSFKTCTDCADAQALIQGFFTPIDNAATKQYHGHFCASYGEFFSNAQEWAEYVKQSLLPGQYYRILKERVQARRRRAAAREARK